MTAAVFSVLPIGNIYPDPNQPRRTGMEDNDLVDLVGSIKVQGLTEVLRVTADGTGRYMIVTGERRYRAALKAGLLEVPAMVCEELSDVERLEIQLTKTLLRRNLTIQERADAIARFTALHPEHKDAAKRLGISNGHLSSLLELQDLSPEVAALADTKVTKDATTLVLANQLMKKAPDVAKAVLTKAAEDGKLTRKTVADALAPYRRPKKADALSESDVSGSPAEQISPPSAISRVGTEDVASLDAEDRPLVRAPSKEKLRKVCAALRIQPGADPATIFEQLVDRFLATTHSQDLRAA